MIKDFVSHIWILARFGQILPRIIATFFHIFLWMIATLATNKKFLKKTLIPSECISLLSVLGKLVMTFWKYL
jgi:hypothetical protein